MIRILKNNIGGSISFILLGTFFILFLINCYLIITNFSLAKEEKDIIKLKIESSYNQSENVITNNFPDFCKIRDFINPNYKVKKAVIIRPAINETNVDDRTEGMFNLEEINNNTKIPLNSVPLTTSEAIDVIDSYCISSGDSLMKEKITEHLKTEPTHSIIYYEYNDSSNKILIKNIIKLRKENKKI